jgi:hypothetical protein
MAEIIMHINLKTTLGLLSVLLLTGCASAPNGPSAMALPGTGKSFDQFRNDDSSCRQYALQQIGGKTANQAANESMAQTAALGAALGAAVGATQGSQAAGVGAATGLLMGSAIGSGEAQVSSYAAQRGYDNAYIQCMYAMGHRVPIYGNFRMEEQPAHYPPTRYAPSNYPPPPSGYSIPPPPGSTAPSR